MYQALASQTVFVCTINSLFLMGFSDSTKNTDLCIYSLPIACTSASVNWPAYFIHIKSCQNILFFRLFSQDFYHILPVVPVVVDSSVHAPSQIRHQV